ncbi:MAG: inositol-3-phosphate synthase [Promethearchaeota archaeon]
MPPIKVVLVGIGNCAAALVQGLAYYKNSENLAGVAHPVLAGYSPRDVEVVGAIDVDARKVGRDLADAIFAPPNVVSKVVDVPVTGVVVERGDVLDGFIEEVSSEVEVAPGQPCDVVATFQRADVVVALLPSGAHRAVEFYAEKALQARVAFVNATPTPIATDETWAAKFKEKGVPVVGDDLQDQVGSTILQKLLLREMNDRGVRIKESYSLDVGGGLDSLNSLFRARADKRAIKSKSVQAALPYEAPIVSGTTDYVPHLRNRRDTHVWIVGQYFMGEEVVIDMKVQTADGANGGSVLLDVIRATKIALQEGAAGAIGAISAYGFKNPPGGTVFPKQARELLAGFLLGSTL